MVLPVPVWRWGSPVRIPVYQIDAFIGAALRGNPAGVCPLPEWLPDAVMQRIAAEMNLSETAFFVPQADGYQLRWFTPTTEVELCGHATLASAFVIARILKPRVRRIVFSSRSGPLAVDVDGELIRLDFPAVTPRRAPLSRRLMPVLGFEPLQTRSSGIGYWLARTTRLRLRRLQPDLAALAALDCTGLVVTAQGLRCDFVSRFFAPRLGVPEDPVTGSAHCLLVPFWAARLGKEQLHAQQWSARGGELFCEARGGRVWIAGRAAKYLQGSIEA